MLHQGSADLSATAKQQVKKLLRADRIPEQLLEPSAPPVRWCQDAPRALLQSRDFRGQSRGGISSGYGKRQAGSCWRRKPQPGPRDAAWSGCPVWERACGQDQRGRCAPPPTSLPLQPLQTVEAARRCERFHPAGAPVEALSPVRRARRSHWQWIQSSSQSCAGKLPDRRPGVRL